MRNLILAGAAALAFTAAPALADHHMDGEAYAWSADQEAMYDAWPADRQSAYDRWPGDVQQYYWTLTPAQTEGWWVLTDAQRVSIYEMTPEARAQAWAQVAAQIGPDAAPVAPSASASAPTAPRFVSKEVSQSTPAGYTAASGENLPVCDSMQQDGCINSWAKNKTGNRPLEYWPGQPASEIPGKLPAKKPGS